MARCEPVSRASLLANFNEMPSELVDNLRTMIVGPDYAARKHDLSDDTNFVGDYDEVSGVTAAWPGILSGEVVDGSVTRVFVASALARYFSEALAGPTAANGVQNGTAPNEVIHDSGNTIWAGTNRSVSVITDVLVGDHVYFDTDGAGADAFESTITDIKFSGGNPTILVLADSLPAALTGGAFFNVNIDEIITPELELPSSDFTSGTSTISVNSGITTTTTRTGTAVPVVSGEDPYSELFVDYRALRQDNVGTILSITNLDQMDTYFDGWEEPESGLGFAVARALAPQPDPPVADLPAVLASPVATNDSTGWSDLMSRIQRRIDWYTIAPLTLDTSLQAIVLSSVDARAILGLPSRAVISLILTEESNLFTGSEAITLSGGDLTVTATNPIFDGAIAGDVVTLDIGERTIDSVTSNQEVVLTTAATGATTVTSVDHPLTVAEQADDYGTRAQVFGDRDTSVIFPPDPTWNGETVEGFLYAAAVAGLRGYTMPHQSLRGVQLDSGWAVPQSTFEFLGELESVAAYGVFVIEDCDGSAVVFRANTTDQSTTEDRTEGLVANADAITRFFNDRLSCFEGRKKVTVDTLSAIRVNSSSGGEFLKSETFIEDFGAVLVSIALSPPVQDPNNADTVNIPITVVLSAGLEFLEIDITVTLEVV